MKISLAIHFVSCFLNIFNYFSWYMMILDIFAVFFYPHYARAKNMLKLSHNSSCVNKYVENI